MTTENNGKSDLELFKEDYSELQKKFGLPSFEEMNESFSIEKLSEKESDLLLREIRRFVGEYLGAILRMCENLMNPANAPMFVFSIVKNFGEDEKSKLKECYKTLSKLEIDFLQLDLMYNPKEEAKFIKLAFEKGNEVKKDLFEVLEFAKSKWDSKSEGNGRGYFG